MSNSFKPTIGDRKFSVIYSVIPPRYKANKVDEASDPKIEIEQIEEGGDIVDATIDLMTRTAIESLALAHYYGGGN